MNSCRSRKGCDVEMSATMQGALLLGRVLEVWIERLLHLSCCIQYTAALPIGRALDKEMRRRSSADIQGGSSYRESYRG